MTNPITVTEHEPCPNWDEMDDTGYCRNCGGPEIVHEPHLTKIFDLMDRYS